MAVITVAYRHQNGVDHAAVAMAVVAQQMVPSDVSGIMFTANPATGERSEIIINASFGLGEAVVSGLVTPDTYIVNRETGEVTTNIGAKEQRVVSDGEQGVRPQLNLPVKTSFAYTCRRLIDLAL